MTNGEGPLGPFAQQHHPRDDPYDARRLHVAEAASAHPAPSARVSGHPPSAAQPLLGYTAWRISVESMDGSVNGPWTAPRAAQWMASRFEVYSYGRSRPRAVHGAVHCGHPRHRAVHGATHRAVGGSLRQAAGRGRGVRARRLGDMKAARIVGVIAGMVLLREGAERPLAIRHSSCGIAVTVDSRTQSS
eukprot:gene14361-biopygen10455